MKKLFFSGLLVFMSVSLAGCGNKIDSNILSSDGGYWLLKTDGEKSYRIFKNDGTDKELDEDFKVDNKEAYNVVYDKNKEQYMINFTRSSGSLPEYTRIIITKENLKDAKEDKKLGGKCYKATFIDADEGLDISSGTLTKVSEKNVLKLKKETKVKKENDKKEVQKQEKEEKKLYENLCNTVIKNIKFNGVTGKGYLSGANGDKNYFEHATNWYGSEKIEQFILNNEKYSILESLSNELKENKYKSLDISENNFEVKIINGQNGELKNREKIKLLIQNQDLKFEKEITVKDLVEYPKEVNKALINEMSEYIIKRDITLLADNSIRSEHTKYELKSVLYNSETGTGIIIYNNTKSNLIFGFYAFEQNNEFSTLLLGNESLLKNTPEDASDDFLPSKIIAKQKLVKDSNYEDIISIFKENGYILQN